MSPAEYTRLLGYPHGCVLEGRALELANWARAWYAKNGQPWIYARQAESLEIAGDTIQIDGMPFTSKRLQSTLEQADAHSAILVAVGAGPEAEEEARRRWEDEKPDEYFFLEMFGSAVVEHLTTAHRSQSLRLGGTPWHGGACLTTAPVTRNGTSPNNRSCSN